MILSFRNDGTLPRVPGTSGVNTSDGNTVAAILTTKDDQGPEPPSSHVKGIHSVLYRPHVSAVSSKILEPTHASKVGSSVQNPAGEMQYIVALRSFQGLTSPAITGSSVGNALLALTQPLSPRALVLSRLPE
jgi:hypothetical protein